MKLALIGYGKMGRMIEEVALQRGHEIVAIVDRSDAKATSREITFESMAAVDVAIDFSHPSAAVENIRSLASLKKSFVVGVTGWMEHLAEVEAIVKKAEVGAIYGSNFSIGVNLFYQVVGFASKLLSRFEAYDVGVTEAHHNQKVDSPSGTALSIADIILEAFSERSREDLPISSLRCGSIPGTHSVIFDSPVDTITLTHEARSRQGFALGAVMAAEWVAGKRGLFTVDEMVKEVLERQR